MPTNYSCFVSTSSSIFQTKKSNIRIYSDIDEIVKLYQDKPIQRSLNYLREMGVKSGVTIPLPVSNLISGFLFLNSTSIAKFSKLGDQDYTALCLIKLIGLSCLNKAFFGINGVDNRLGKTLATVHQEKNTFASETF